MGKSLPQVSLRASEAGACLARCTISEPSKDQGWPDDLCSPSSFSLTALQGFLVPAQFLRNPTAGVRLMWCNAVYLAKNEVCSPEGWRQRLPSVKSVHPLNPEQRKRLREPSASFQSHDLFSRSLGSEWPRYVNARNSAELPHNWPRLLLPLPNMQALHDGDTCKVSFLLTSLISSCRVALYKAFLQVHSMTWSAPSPSVSGGALLA